MELLQLVGGRLKQDALIRQKEVSLILSHRIALALLDRKDRNLPARLRTSVPFEVPGGKVNRRLERFAALAARLARLGSRDLPLPGRLHRLDLPLVPQVTDEMGAWTGTGLAGKSSLQGPAPAWLRLHRPMTSVMQAPSRAVSVAVVGTRTGAGQSAALVAGQRGRQPRKASSDERAAVPRTREANLPASRLRSAVAAVAAVQAAVAGSGGRNASGQQGPGSRVLSVALPLHAGSTAGGNREAGPRRASRQAPGRRAVSAGRLGSNRAAALEVMNMAQVKVAQPAALPAGSGSSPATGLALPIAVGASPLEVPAPGSMSGARQGLVVLQRSVVSLPRTGLSQDILRRHVVPSTSMPNRPPASSADRTMWNGAGNQQAAFSPAVMENGSGADGGRMVMVSLTGDVVIDGRRLGQVAASSQASRASLPAHGPSRVNLRAVPIHPGMQIPQ